MVPPDTIHWGLVLRLHGCGASWDSLDISVMYPENTAKPKPKMTGMSLMDIGYVLVSHSYPEDGWLNMVEYGWHLWVKELAIWIWHLDGHTLTIWTWDQNVLQQEWQVPWTTTSPIVLMFTGWMFNHEPGATAPQMVVKSNWRLTGYHWIWGLSQLILVKIPMFGSPEIFLPWASYDFQNFGWDLWQQF